MPYAGSNHEEVARLQEWVTGGGAMLKGRDWDSARVPAHDCEHRNARWDEEWTRPEAWRALMLSA
eukprot:scaffold29647_cov145-Isochrysis_galbana.AAC.10